MNKKVLVIAAYPDDELLGVGGTVAKHVRNGDEVYSVIVCEGESLHYKKDVGQAIAISEAAKTLGVSKSSVSATARRCMKLCSPMRSVNTLSIWGISIVFLQTSAGLIMTSISPKAMRTEILLLSLILTTHSI